MHPLVKENAAGLAGGFRAVHGGVGVTDGVVWVVVPSCAGGDPDAHGVAQGVPTDLVWLSDPAQERLANQGRILFGRLAREQHYKLIAPKPANDVPLPWECLDHRR